MAGKSITSTGIAIDFNSGTANAGNLKVINSEGGTVFNVAGDDYSVQASSSFEVGTPGTSASGRIRAYDSGNKFFDLNVDDGLVMSTGFPIVLQGTAALGTISGLGTNQAVLYVDVSGGKHRVMAKFATGAAVVMATEP